MPGSGIGARLRWRVQRVCESGLVEEQGGAGRSQTDASQTRHVVDRIWGRAYSSGTQAEDNSLTPSSPPALHSSHLSHPAQPASLHSHTNLKAAASSAAPPRSSFWIPEYTGSFSWAPLSPTPLPVGPSSSVGVCQSCKSLLSSPCTGPVSLWLACFGITHPSVSSLLSGCSPAQPRSCRGSL